MTVKEFVQDSKEILKDSKKYQHALYYTPQDNFEMPFAPTEFMYSWAFFNSIYNIDWIESLSSKGEDNTHSLVIFDRVDSSENSRITNLIKFLYNTKYGRFDSSILVSEFRKCKYQKLDSIKETVDLTDAVNIDPDDVNEFFNEDKKEVNEKIKSYLSKALQHNNIFEWQLKNIIKYIYVVRCNIFHGVKTLSMMQKPGQNNRIRLYSHIINCVSKALLDKVSTYIRSSH